MRGKQKRRIFIFLPLSSLCISDRRQDARTRLYKWESCIYTFVVITSRSAQIGVCCFLFWKAKVPQSIGMIIHSAAAQSLITVCSDLSVNTMIDAY